MSKTVQEYIEVLEQRAAESGNANAFWQFAGLCLVIWSSGGVPSVDWNPHVHRDLMPLFKSYECFGSELREAVDARVFAAA